MFSKFVRQVLEWRWPRENPNFIQFFGFSEAVCAPFQMSSLLNFRLLCLDLQVASYFDIFASMSAFKHLP